MSMMEHRSRPSYGGSSASNNPSASPFSTYSARRRASLVAGGAAASGHTFTSSSAGSVSGAAAGGSGTSVSSSRRVQNLVGSAALRNAGLSHSFPLPSSSSPATSSQNQTTNPNAAPSNSTTTTTTTTNSNIHSTTIPIRRGRFSQQLSESSASGSSASQGIESSERPAPPSHSRKTSLSITTSAPRRPTSLRQPGPLSPTSQPLKSPFNVQASRGQGTPISSLSRSLTHHRRTTSTYTPSNNSKEELPLSPLSPTSVSFGSTTQLISSGSSSQSKTIKSPARFSSNGIATSSGPPPSLAFRNMDFSRSKKPAPPLPSRKSSTVTEKRVSMDRRESTTSNDDNDTMDSQRTIRPIDDIKRRRMELEEKKNEAKKREEEMFANIEQDTEPESDHNEDQTQDNADSGDVFFSLARSNSVSKEAKDADTTRSELRRSRIAQKYAAQRASLPANTFSHSRSPVREPSTKQLAVTETNPDPITWRHSTHASPSPSELALRRQRSESIGSGGEELSPKMLRKTPSRPRSIYSGASPIASREDLNQSSEVPLRQSSLLRNHESASYSPVAPPQPEPELPHRPTIQQLVESDSKRLKRGVGSEMGGGDDSASTVSTTAPSTVWDELDDLKSRIRRLELTGRMPASNGGGASNSSGERPRTATTTMTTLSSSPRNKGSSNGTGASPPRPNNIGAISMTPQTPSHPLLKAALTKAESSVSPEAFKYLQSVASDALGLAGYVGSTGTPGTVGSSPIPDRQLRRKVDSMCRSLTEFCIALSESRPAPSVSPQPPSAHRQLLELTSSRPSAREMLDSPRLRAESSLSSHKPASLSSYALRRGSTISINTRPSVAPSIAASDFAPSPTLSLPASRLSTRTSALRRDGSVRAPSRAATEFHASASEYAGPSLGSPMLSASETLALRRRERAERAEREREQRNRDREVMTLNSSPPRPSNEDLSLNRRVLDISGRGLVESRLRTGALGSRPSVRRSVGSNLGRTEEWDE